MLRGEVTRWVGPWESESRGSVEYQLTNSFTGGTEEPCYTKAGRNADDYCLHWTDFGKANPLDRILTWLPRKLCKMAMMTYALGPAGTNQQDFGQSTEGWFAIMHGL